MTWSKYMAPRQKNERASLESRSYRTQTRRRFDLSDRLIEIESSSMRKRVKPYDKSYRRQYERNGNSANRTTFEHELKKDIAASKRVLQMISSGAARMLNRALSQI